jgi:tetratricopeptide (TPR) repeat protein
MSSSAILALVATLALLIPNRSTPLAIRAVSSPGAGGGCMAARDSGATRPGSLIGCAQSPGQAYETRMQRGYQLLQGGDFTGAVGQFTAALELRPGDLQASFLLGTALRGAGDLDGAAATFEALSVSHPRAPNGPFGLGQVQLQRGDPSAAEASLREALRRDSDYVRAWFFLGEALRAQQRTDQAAAAYREALRRNPTGRPSALALAEILLAEGGAGEALEVLRPIARTSAGDPAVAAPMSVALAGVGDFERAFSLLEALDGPPALAADWFNIGLTATQAEQWQWADEALGRALQADPGHVPSRLLLSELLEAGGEPRRAEEVLQEGIDVVTDDARLRRALAALYINRSAGQLSEAAQILRQLLAESPGDDDVRRALATVYADTGQLEPALELFRELEARHPADPAIAYRIGYVQSHLGDNEAARVALDRALQGAPGLVDATYELGIIDLREQRFEQSAERLRQVVRQDPYRTGAYVNLARALRGMGREDAARQAALRARELQLLEAQIEDARTALRLRPGEALNYLELGRLLVETGGFAEAASVLRTALRLNPALREARDLLQQIDGR